MCGIVGIRAETLQRTGGDFTRALRALAWRGRDGAGAVQIGGWHLGVTRLAISDPAAGQPIHCRHSGRVALFNGAVTSAVEEWQRYGVGRATHNDAELPLLRLRHAGLGHLAPRCGHHALAVVAPDGSAWLGRDAFGEKPLYSLRANGRTVAFASTVAALRELGFRIELGDPEVAHFFRYGWHRTPTVAAPELTLNDDQRGVWSADDGSSCAQAQLPWQPRTLRARVQSAVERCATAEVAVGLALSGGIDSACIAACLAAAGRRSAPAFQFRAHGSSDGERRLATQVAAHHGMQVVPVDAGAEILANLLPLTRALGLPIGDPSTLAAHAIAKAAAGAGVRVLLTGEGGDEMFFGYRRYRAAAWLPRRPQSWLPPAPTLAHGYFARAWRAVRTASHAELLAVAPPGVAARALAAEVALPPAIASDAGDALARAVAVDRDAYLRRDLLPKLDVATLFAGVEGRCPLLDAEVVAAPETDPGRARHDLGKRALRIAFADELPASVRRQRKRGLALPLDRWLRQDSFLPDLLRDRRTLERPHVVAAGLTELLDAHRAGRLALGHALYLFAAFELYLRVREEPACEP